MLFFKRIQKKTLKIAIIAVRGRSAAYPAQTL